MNNHKLIPFERNKYFYGKLLTVRDFEVEQKYFNDKRRLLNRILLGPGILAGLNVLAVDDKTLLLEPGIALDYLGREIINDSPFTSRLSVIEGFNALAEYGDAYLNIAYQETPKEAVHNLSTQDSSESEYNRLREGYKLTLTSEAPSTSHTLLDLIAIKQYVLVDDEYFKIILALEHVANVVEGFNTTLNIFKKQATSALKIKVTLSAHFINYGQEIVLDFDETAVENKTEYHLNFPFKITNVPPQDDLILLKTFHLETDQLHIDQIDVTIKHTVQIDEVSKMKQIEAKYHLLSLDDLLAASAGDIVCLAKLKILKTDKTYVIEQVIKNPMSQYLSNFQLQRIRQSYTAFPYGIGASDEHSDVKAFASEEPNSEPEASFTTGVIKFLFSEKVSPKEKFFSEEIEHSLGAGDVFIKLSFDSETSDGDSSFGHQNQLIFGDMEVFEKSNYEPVIPVMKSGTIVYKNKGSFVVGIQFLETFSRSELVVKWQATRVNKRYDPVVKSENQLVIQPAMSKVRIRETISFNVFKNGETVDCIWRVREVNGGEIDQNGVYMSPSIEGVYEVIAQIPDYNESLSAYVVVEN